MYEYRANSSISKGLPLPAFAFTNGGGIRATIDAGNITRGEILTALPFGNSIVEFELTGQQIWDTFEGVLSRVNKNDTTRKVTSFVQVSSQAQIRWTPTNVTENPSIGTLTSFNISGKPLDLKKTYKVVTIDFIAGGGDSIFVPSITGAFPLDGLAETLEVYVRTHTPITASIEGRLAYEQPKKCRKRRRGVKRTVNSQ